MRAVFAVIALVVVSGCVSGATQAPSANASVTPTPSQAPVQTHIEATGRWALEAPGNAFVGSGAPQFSPPAHLTAGTISVTWNATSADTFEIRMHDRAQIVWTHALDKSPTTLVLGADDLKHVENGEFVDVRAVTTAAAQVTFHVVGDFTSSS